MDHKPVLTDKVMQYLDPQPGKIIIDGTLDGCGHSQEISKRLQGNGLIIGIEIDKDLVKQAIKKNIRGLIVEKNNYKNMKEVIAKHNIRSVDGVLLDFGMSSWHLEESGRGFSFQRNEPLDMRFSHEEEKTAASIINSLPENDLADIFQQYGEERHARKIAHAIVATRKHERIIQTQQLVEIVRRCTPRAFFRTHSTTKIFQALRIAVNDELNNVRAGIQAAMEVVKPGGRVVAISFHSLEDRIVKSAFRTWGTVLTKKGVSASRAEQLLNPRSRSARLRAWENKS
ncbi:MAG: 16S rRNA (cytosine(1402)-N(4))-methyltransferase [Candidatus Ryanbacteria bacterium RIFCSPHIGHO2_12_FULL_47_12b]|uniref:Ribosomal RNA small subunit methyltransferase H n=1 Tax=Candidatus Ryanbacteria bacterium RIFCSPLOWO2_02_FULL_47_14 TaxID=1802129 RepID=A0A1G2H124_9BACT|nr:MAG: Ribosomal RNA small subunit methyltransferase H [Parcubacteria group bacterium GW2011_GWA2_47_10b]OGZ46093.1 MAG: 16S rRNA (cytosine(1402)-N(4))-methyltransferase [Candidatus Ryanbacteria bacterium RIFCSPHIGHO2_01_FULL_48_80]OGZ52335.1 MAG: 16S rRNA (cytosine(1402)-N(4))-methyltransferase [Candidatus Ryanbacteria bacterium RIFCSPHIGHO2_12_FULL_47_12b]OGZ53210.1 MAG: 16S rRNA (cytosine(1402)-N(4))-methyltransferase [Candidatus Ryanbacteria bacterium RIFCSPLOWO2_01_FULL_47_79]OGZ56186.1 M